ncbi:hypothetical protein CTI14_50745, partial [Methylobacterium radiotolerans]
WQSYLDTCAALKKIGVYGYGTSAGAGSFTGGHILVSWMINNGGGLFDEKQQPNCVTQENIDAMNFVLELVSKGYVDPASPTYTSANAQAHWQSYLDTCAALKKIGVYGYGTSAGAGSFTGGH